MHDFLIKEIINSDLKEEIAAVGYDKHYSSAAAEKFRYKNFKIYDLTPPQANILKQLALSAGADCATHRETITCGIKKADCILGGSISQLKKIAGKLTPQPFGLNNLAQRLTTVINQTVSHSKTQIMGILNITENSFSDGGMYNDYDNAVRHLNELIADGADIIDIGAESTKPYSASVPAEKQLEKILPLLDYISTNNIKIPVSIDTRSSVAAKECINAGASIINDVSGFDYDENMPDIIARNPHVKIILQHSKGTPENMQNSPKYKNLTDEIFKSLYNKMQFALSKGIKKENIIVDPGIGFGKTKENNFEILKRREELKTLGCPVLIGISRKSLLGMPDASNTEKDIYSLALNSILISSGIDYIRVHNVKLHRKFIDMLD